MIALIGFGAFETALLIVGLAAIVIFVIVVITAPNIDKDP